MLASMDKETVFAVLRHGVADTQPITFFKIQVEGRFIQDDRETVCQLFVLIIQVRPVLADFCGKLAGCRCCEYQIVVCREPRMFCFAALLSQGGGCKPASNILEAMPLAPGRASIVKSTLQLDEP